MASTFDKRLQAVLGDTEPLERSTTAAAWAEGYGIATPEVTRYAEVLRGAPDAILLAMRTLATEAGDAVLDGDTANLLSLWVRARQPQHVLEIGTGVGYATLQLARAVPSSCSITSIDSDPIRQGQAHAFLQRDDFACAVELRLGDPMRLLREGALRSIEWDLVVFTDPTAPRLEILELVTPQLAADALVAVPWALRGGRAADGATSWEPGSDVDVQRTLNRHIGMDPHFSDVTLLPVGDGLLLARAH